MSYTNQANVEAFLKRSLTNDELTMLPMIFEAVDQYINDQVGGSFGEVSATTRYYDGGTRIIEIDTCTELTKVASVSRDETELTEYTLDEAYEQRPRNETYKTWIEKRDSAFPKGVANIAITAKFTENLVCPEDIIYIATYLTGQLYGKSITGNLKSESIEGYSRTFSALLEENQVIKLTLNKYIKDDTVLC